MKKATPEERMEILLGLHKDSLDRIKRTKDMWVNIDDRGDIPPVVIVEKDGEELCTVFAPKVDKMLGLKAADLLQRGFDPDFLTIMMDAHYATGKKDESREEFSKRFPPGSMQKMCDEDNACAVGLITDCILSMRVGRDGKILMIKLPYTYHGKGSDFAWYDDKALISDENDPEFEGKSGGNIPTTLRKIMESKSLLEMPDLVAQIQGIKKLIESGELSEDQVPKRFQEFLNEVQDKPAQNPWELFGLNKEEAHLHAGKAALTVLMHEGFHALVSKKVMGDGGFADPSVQGYPLHGEVE